jgi:hypothetical protein
MADLTNSGVIKLKGILFLLLGLLASALLLIEHPSIRELVLLAIAIWSFCRFYYFAFYVIEHYIDARFRFAGLWSFFRYMVGKRARSLKHQK